GKMNFTDCGHNEIKELSVSNCTGNYCVIHRGKPLTLDAKFDANQDTASVGLVLTAIIDGDIAIDIPGLETNACKLMKCPIRKGEHQELIYNIGEIPDATPEIKAKVKAQLIGEHGVLACGWVDGEVQE
uniref:Mite group 2 allergen Gly d 2.01 n=1 Tax=Glycyphagus domesticus TaxID=105145 RepID=ALL21_GLYDO